MEASVKTSNLKLFTALIISLVMLLAGCGNKSAASQKPDGNITSFENLQSESQIGDFNWETLGYVTLEQFNKYGTNGKFSCKATFSIPVDFMSTTEAARTSSWITAMTINLNTLTPLKVTDWSVFKKFGLDVYTPDTLARNIYIKFNDVNGKEFISLQPLKAGKTKLEVLIEDVKNSRIDIKNITSLSLYLNTKNEPKDVILYIDNVRLIP